MKMLFLLLILVSCTSHRNKTTSNMKSPEWDANVNCSKEALSYFSQKDAGRKTNAKAIPVNPLLVREQILLIQPAVATCYNSELKKDEDLPELNLCLAVATDKEGKIEYSNFHVSEAELSKDFYECVNATIKNIDLSAFKDANITQPMKLKNLN